MSADLGSEEISSQLLKCSRRTKSDVLCLDLALSSGEVSSSSYAKVNKHLVVVNLLFPHAIGCCLPLLGALQPGFYFHYKHGVRCKYQLCKVVFVTSPYHTPNSVDVAVTFCRNSSKLLLLNRLTSIPFLVLFALAKFDIFLNE